MGGCMRGWWRAGACALSAVLALQALPWVTASAGAASGYQLRVSATSARTSARALQGATLTGAAYVFLTPASHVARVTYWVDDPHRTKTARHGDTRRALRPHRWDNLGCPAAVDQHADRGDAPPHRSGDDDGRASPGPPSRLQGAQHPTRSGDATHRAGQQQGGGDLAQLGRDDARLQRLPKHVISGGPDPPAQRFHATEGQHDFLHRHDSRQRDEVLLRRGRGEHSRSAVEVLSDCRRSTGCARADAATSAG